MLHWEWSFWALLRFGYILIKIRAGGLKIYILIQCKIAEYFSISIIFAIDSTKMSKLAEMLCMSALLLWDPKTMVTIVPSCTCLDEKYIALWRYRHYILWLLLLQFSMSYSEQLKLMYRCCCGNHHFKRLSL